VPEVVSGQVVLGRSATDVAPHPPATVGEVAAVRPWERAYFAAVALLALWVGGWGFFVPSRVDAALPFLVPPLHARFLGVMYLSGLAMMIGGLLARRWCEIRVLPPMTALWTGGLFVVSLLHLEAFDLDAATARVTIWFAAYLAYPLLAVGLMWRHRHDRGDVHGGPSVPAWATTYLRVQGVVASALALALLVAPAAMAGVWPWPITSLLAQIYFAPLLAYGVGSFVLAAQRSGPDIRAGAVAMLVFAAGVLAASGLHLDLFSADDAAAWLWFAAFSTAAAGLAAVAGWSLRARSGSVS
jgi:hypothetical protein